jgi:hypothetical protein
MMDLVEECSFLLVCVLLVFGKFLIGFPLGTRGSLQEIRSLNWVEKRTRKRSKGGLIVVGNVVKYGATKS